jgi:hypothetical protein
MRSHQQVPTALFSTGTAHTRFVPRLFFRVMLKICIALLQIAIQPVASAQDLAAERGRALYEARCDTCHESSVHKRSPRSASDFAQIREFVMRWDRHLGSSWRDDEINAVTRYLNDRYYKYPCPQTICSLQRAENRR